MTSGFKPDSPHSPRLGSALERLDALVDWERRDRSAGAGREMRVTVEPSQDLQSRLGHPGRRFLAVHITGSKGKGSVAALVAHGLGRAGWAAGTYGSPHVERVNERIRLPGGGPVGDPVADEPLAAGLERALDAREAALAEGSPGARATWFDVLTAAGFLILAEAGVRVGVIECGLGGRLDSTNVLAAPVAVVTNLLLEHTAILGSTRAAIAREKVGILHPGGILVHGAGSPPDEAVEVLEARAVELGCGVRRALATPGAPLGQRNLALARAALDALAEQAPDLDLPPAAELLGPEALASVQLPARLERRRVGSVPVVLDGAHVPESVDAVLSDLDGQEGLSGAPVVVLGLGRDKDAPGVLKVLLARVDTVLSTSVETGPVRTPEELSAYAAELGRATTAVASPRRALEEAVRLAGSEGWVLVTGSLHLAGAVRDLTQADTRTYPPCSRSSRTCS